MTAARAHVLDPREIVEEIYRTESRRVLATLIDLLGDFERAEEAMHDAFAAAVEQWPHTGMPARPRAWLISTGRFKAIDSLRQRARFDASLAEFALRLEQDTIDPRDWDDERIPDDRLRLIFTCCHPALPPDAQIALTLREVCGLTTEEIARAFLVREPTVAQRIVRAKRTLSEARVPFEVPEGADRNARVVSVLEVLYLVFNEGYSATAGDDWMRPALCEDALRLGRILAELLPEEPEVHGLVALMEIQASRMRARVGPSGAPILLLDQDRSRWDHVLIRRGLAALERAEKLGRGFGPYALQAAIAACHARAPSASETDWIRIAALYDALAQLTPSPVVELNRAVAYSRAFGPEVGLELVDALHAEPALRGYHLLPSVRGDLLEQLGRFDEARVEFERAAALTRNSREGTLLSERAALLGARGARGAGGAPGISGGRPGSG
jgi:RNA polymerase sigma-70 factor (ECF subfamily)